MIIKNLWRRKTRSLLTMLGVAVGVAAVLAFSAFGEGFASGFENIFSTSEADLTISQKDSAMALISSVDLSVKDEVLSIPGVEEVCGTVIGVVQMTDAPYFIVMGEDPKGFPIQHYKLISGSPLTGRKQILLGKSTAENFKKNLGDAFRINDVVYRVVGIYETGVAMEDGGAVMRLDDAQRAFKSRDKVNFLNVKVEDKSEIPQIKAEIEKRFPKLSATRSGEATQQTDMLDLYRSFGWFLGLFAVLVGGLGMMNATLMSVFERTREIGVLRALGWGRMRVISLIMGESLLISFLGGLVGIGLGIGMTTLARLTPAVESLLSGVFTPEMFIQAMATALLLGTVGGIYPAWRAAQLAPVEAMRYDSGAGNVRVRLPWLLRVVRLEALRNLWRRPMRSLITIAGISIGVGFIVALIAMTEGMTITFGKILGAGQADLMAEEANVSDMGLSEINERTAIQLSGQPEVAHISKVVMGFTSAPGMPYFIIFGLDLNEDYINHYRIRQGRSLENNKEIIIGQVAANNMKRGIGETLRLSGGSYKIVGIYENGSIFEDIGAAITYHDSQDLFNKRRTMSLISVTLKEEYRKDIDQTIAVLEERFPEIVLMQSSGFTESMQDFATTYAVLNALIVLTIIVGGIVMTNAMLMSVFERTQEIGVLRALGWRRRKVILMVVGESLAISAASALVGMAIGVGLNYLILLEPTMGVMMEPAYNTKLFVEVFLLALALGVIGGVYPAWRAANLRPIEALRYE